MKNDWLWYFVIAIFLVGVLPRLIHSLFDAYMFSQGYKCTEWSSNLFGTRNRCIKWDK